MPYFLNQVDVVMEVAPMKNKQLPPVRMGSKHEIDEMVSEQ
jgi:hypothetical protein